MKRCSYKNASDDTRAIFGRGGLFSKDITYLYIRGDYGFFDETGKRGAKRYRIDNIKEGYTIGHIGNKTTAILLVRRFDEKISRIVSPATRAKKIANYKKRYGVK